MGWLDEQRLGLWWGGIVSALDHVQTGIALLEAETWRYLYVNDTLARFNYRSVDEHRGRTVRDILPSQWEHYEPIYRRVLTGETVHQGWYDVPAGDKTASIEAVFSPVRDEAGRVGAVLVEVRDVSLEHERGRLAEQLLDMSARLNLAVTAGEIADVVASFAASPARVVDAGVYLLEGDVLHRVARTVSDEVALEQITALERAQLEVIPRGEPWPVWTAVEQQRDVWLDDAESWQPYPNAAVGWEQMGKPVVGVSPLQVGGRVFGCLYLTWARGQVGPDERRYVSTLTGLTAAALDRAARVETESRLREQRDRVSASLQTALLPRPTVTGVRLATAYRPGDDRLLLGGDFYDAVSLDSGEVALLIGDVTGHGPEPAAVGAAMRAAWRAAARSQVPHSFLVDVLDAVLTSERTDRWLLASAITGILDPRTRTFRFTNAGHPAPLVATSAGAAPGPSTRGTLLGLPLARRRPEAVLELPPACRLVLYTDGLIEGRTGPGHPQLLGQDGLLELLGRHPHLLDDPADLVGLVNQTHGGHLPDDVAVLVLSLEDDGEPER
jgi:GAF domain-containing protein